MGSNFLRAKEIFDSYNGSKYQMAREGVLSEYLSYEIPVSTELEWINELFYKQFNQTDIYNCHSFIYLSTFVSMHTQTVLDKLYLIEEKVRSFGLHNACENKIKILIDSILEDLSKMEQNELVNNEVKRFDDLRSAYG